MAVESNLLGQGDQEAQLEEAIKVVRKEAFEMKRCLDKQKVLDALRHATNMLMELKANNLSPKFYYRLYIDATNELQHLQSYLTDLTDRYPLELYEQVQYAGSIIPRLYLLVTIGVVQMKKGIGNRSDILHDLVEMCRGVQHPLRGLFLRNYLLQTTRDLLPDSPISKGKDEEKAGSVMNAINFILTNFGEMNKLWVRMQHQGPSREREKREKERMELRILVGTNMVRLSQLNHLTYDVYAERVLPSILEQVVSCHDAISQEYLMECIIQVFADDFHLATLKEFLSACGELNGDVNMKTVLGALIERVAVLANEDSRGQGSLFTLFAQSAQNVISSRAMPTEDIVALHASLASLALKGYPDRVDFGNTVYDSLHKILTEKGVKDVSQLDGVGRELLRTLRLAVDEYATPSRICQLQSFVPLTQLLDHRSQCRNAATLLQEMVEKELEVRDGDELEALENLISPLLEDPSPGKVPIYDGDNDDLVEEQNLVAKIIHLVRAADNDLDCQFLLLSSVRKMLGRGGPSRLSFTLPSLLFALFNLALQYRSRQSEDKWDEKMRKLFLFVMSSINGLLEVEGKAELPLRLYVEAALVADAIPFLQRPVVVYEFFSKALSLLEDELCESRSRLTAHCLVSSSLSCTSCLSNSDFDSLANQMVLLSTKLVKKADQARALYATSHLFWKRKVAGEGEGTEEVSVISDGNRLSQIISKALKLSANCIEPVVQLQLLVQLIHLIHHFYAEQCEEMEEETLVELVGRARDCAVQLEPSGEADAVQRQLSAALDAIRRHPASASSLASRLRI